MTRKDYEAIAKILRESDVMTGFDSLCYAMADYMAERNPRFKRDIFLQACNGLIGGRGIN